MPIKTATEVMAEMTEEGCFAYRGFAGPVIPGVRFWRMNGEQLETCRWLSASNVFADAHTKWTLGIPGQTFEEIQHDIKLGLIKAMPVPPKKNLDRILPQHTDACLAQQIKRGSWVLRWPLHCHYCDADGVNRKNGAACLYCIASHDRGDIGNCPRCRRTFDVKLLLEDIENAEECPHCGWANGAGADDHAPIVECHCFE